MIEVVSEIPATVPTLSWEQVVVLLAFFAYQYMSNRDIKKQFKNNGGSTLKDAVDRIELRQMAGEKRDAELAERLEHLEKM